MYFIVPLTLASAVLGLPHQIRNPSSSSLAPNTGSCSGAPPIPFGALPGDGCGAPSPSGAPSSNLTPASSRRGQMKKRQALSTCETVTLAQYQSAPIKSGIEAAATKAWGSDFTVVVNPPEFADSPLHFCYSSGTVPATFDSAPTCNTVVSQVSGNVVNGSADVSLQITQGTSASHVVTTQKSSSITSTTQIGLSLGIPGIDGFNIQETLEIQGSFMQGDTQTTVNNQQTTTTVVAHATKPGPCNVDLNVTTCTGQTTATVPAFYTGFVWFNYPSTRDGHFKWALNVDSVLPADQRSDNTTLTDKITATNNGNFSTACV